MTEFDEAIWNHFSTVNALNTALGGRMYPGEGPQNVTFPYAVQNVVSGGLFQDTTDDREELQWQLSLYSEEYSPAEVNTLYGHAISLFDDAALSITGWDLLMFQRIEHIKIRDIEMATWAYHLTYAAWLEKQRG